ncbi:MAG: neutral/alkaline non-lysosomal ceramidase N-terminal domain-containing protein [Clostridia bacterium]|nr:neutral/alkaline non-lysosomal ceramidase N-terminal domain-containing protein [Clostridia bacterium]
MKCGFYESEITPPLGCNMKGYFRTRLAEGVIEKLYVKAVAVEMDGVCGIVVSVEAEFMPQIVHDVAVERIAAYTGIPSDRVLINATHTHTGGGLGDIHDKSGADSLVYTPDEAYNDVLSRLVGDCGILAYHRLQPASAKMAKTDVHGISFIRNYVMKDGRILMNPGWQNPDVVEPFGTLDPELGVLFFCDEQGNPIGAMVNYALHHDCVSSWPPCTMYCSDYSGVMAKELKKTYGENFVTVFVNGCCGNINHFDISRTFDDFFADPPYIRIGQRLADEVRNLYEKAEPLAPTGVGGKKEIIYIERRQLSPEEVQEYKDLIKKYPERTGAEGSVHDPNGEGYKRRRAEAILDFHELPPELPMVVQALKLGNCMMFAVSGEVYSEFGIYMKEHSPLGFSMVSEMANGGNENYIPTRQAFGTDLYEAQISSSSLIPDAGYIMAEHAIKLAEDLCK